ncbi:uncharacterized protein LOC109844484 [Asparagus officinalis]|nr:uncharacterized protein LOC109844484 [Asparagus officinalis]XP_020269129.1 uncharacterized protein LOC109844484 [Asparagus officinalis]XP_020269130.1 uncharacterized protein LOC109844484 [Asparagus officinalis]
MEGLEQEEEGDIRDLERYKPPVHISFRAKLIEILKDLHSPEVQIYSEASKEFVGLLEGDLGGEVLREYIQLSPRCSEILESWRLHQGKPGMFYILSLVSALLDHPVVRTKSAGIIKNIHELGDFLLTKKLDDIYTELNSREFRRQGAALLLLSSIVKIGVGLASKAADVFDFKLPVLSKLSGIQKKKAGGKDAKHGTRRSATRPAFVRFAMSFIEAGNSRLLRWILQKREIYSAVFRGLGSDDVDTVVYVLSTLRDKVLSKDSLIPPGLRSVLFGSITLEQLSNISGNPKAGPAADLAHEVLVMVCTDPCNGLMPSMNSKGNHKRLFDLMKKLRATEAAYHKELLLAVVGKIPSLCAAYMDEFPYNLKPRSSPWWFSAVSLAADMISSVNFNTVVASLTSHSLDKPTVDHPEVQNILKCIIPRPFSRSFISTGLQHADGPVKHGTLRIVLESLKSLAGLLLEIDRTVERMNGKRNDTSSKVISSLDGPSVNCFAELDKCLGTCEISRPAINDLETNKWVSVRQLIQDEVRAMLPEPQVLLKLLSSSGQKHSKLPERGLKRDADLPEVGLKKRKLNDASEDIDIIISRIDTEGSNGTTKDFDKLEAENMMEELDVQKDDTVVIAEIWGLSEKTMISSEPNSIENFFQSKLYDAFKFYMRTVPLAVEGSFDFFKLLPVDPSSLSTCQLESLLSLLRECIQQAPGGRISARAPKFLYKHLQRLINILLYSHVKGIREEAYVLARAAMTSTGAFDQNVSEIDVWLSSLTGYCTKSHIAGGEGAEVIHCLSNNVSSFLCDAASTVGNNLYKYLDQMRELISKLENANDDSPGFSPLIICVLEKCLRLLESESRTYKLYEKSMISLYACNTISLILQTQVDARTLSGVVRLILTEKFNGYPSEDMEAKSDLCEWRPVNNLLRFSQGVFDQDSCSLFTISRSAVKQCDGSLSPVLVKVKELLEGDHGVRQVGAAVAFTSSIVCATPQDMLTNFQLLLTVTRQHFRSYLPFLSWVLFLEQGFLANVVDLETNIVSSGLKMIEGVIGNFEGSKLQSLNSNKAPQLSEIEDLLDKEPASSAALFLYSAPFCALFSAIMCVESAKSGSSGKLDVLHSSAMLSLLQVKLSEGSLDDSILSLRMLLFWTNQMMRFLKTNQNVSSRTTTSTILKEKLQMCITLVRYLLDHTLVAFSDVTGFKTLGVSSLTHYVQDVVDFIFQHPVMAFALSQPLSFSSLGNNVQTLMTSQEKFHPVDCNFLRLLRIVFDFVLSARDLLYCSSEMPDFSPGIVLSAPRNFVEDLMESFKLSVLKRDELILPRFYILHCLMKFVSPFELLEVADWMYVELKDSISRSTSSFANVVVSVGLYIVDGALDMIFRYLHQPRMDSQFNSLWEGESKIFNISILLNLYQKILEFGINFNLQCAEACLLKIVTAAYSQRFAKPDPALFPLCTQLSRMIANSPMKMLAYCFYPTSKIKTKILLQLVEVSPLHMHHFGKIFLGILNNNFSDLVLLNKDGVRSAKCNRTNEVSNCAFSNDDFVHLLPVALSYMVFIRHKYGGQELKPLGTIAKFYSRMLLDGFSRWKDYVSQDIFQEDYDEPVPTSLENFHKFCCSTLLGKAITMLHSSLLLSEIRVKDIQLLGIFDSVYSDRSLFDPHLPGCENLGSCSYKESLKILDVVAAKISFARLLLFPGASLTSSTIEENGKSKGIWTDRESNITGYAKRFMCILVDAWEDIITKIPLKFNSSCVSCSAECYPVFRFLEHYILSNIVQLSTDIKIYQREAPSIHFLEQFVKSSLLHRFEDPLTLRAIRCILVALSETRFSSCAVLEQLIRDSKFVPVMVGSSADSELSTVSTSGMLMQPLPSILKSLDISFVDQTVPDGRNTSDMSLGLQSYRCSFEGVRLELVKLLRVLYHLKDQQKNFQSANVDGRNSRELLSLLLSSYGATMSEIDLEIFHLMHEIETIEGSYCWSIAAMDYLWGGSAMKLRNELFLDGSVSSDVEAAKERRKVFFREYIPVDSNLSVMTALHFCSDRSSRIALMSLERLLEDNFVDSSEKISSSNINMVQRYDPAYILAFSNHCLAMGYLEPTEFSRLGLLAISFVSISSPDEELRKLGYNCLGKFQDALKTCQKRKETLPLQLLLTNIQNRITAEWQRIPSVIAIFAAEASLILLDPSQNHFLTLSEFLENSQKIKLKRIPFFPKLFRSGSIHFKMDRLWILRLLCAGLNSDVDAKIYMKQEVLNLLLSFFGSSLADHESKILILQIVKKCVRLSNIALCLIKKHGLVSWLSSILLSYGKRLAGDHQESSLAVIELVLKVLGDGISSGTISQWLQEYAPEQLLDLSSHLHMLIVSLLKLPKGNTSLIKALLSVTVSILKISKDRDLDISQDKKKFRPNLTLSLAGLFQLCQAVDMELSIPGTSSTSEIWLNIILMSAPVPAVTLMDKARLSKLLMLAVPPALQPSSKQKSMANVPNSYLLISCKEHQGEESLGSKLLRWVSASVILGCFTNKCSKMNKFFSISRSEVETLRPIVEEISKKECGGGEEYSSSDEALAVILLYLQQILGRSCSFLPSVILALCLLLLGHSTSTSGNVTLDGATEAIASLCSKIYCPPELNPDWRWYYDRPWPWRDEEHSRARTARELMEEEQACQSMLIMFSNALGWKSSASSLLLHKDVESFGLHEWERETFLVSKHSKKRKQTSK